MNHLRNFLDGFAQAINWGAPQRAYQVTRGGFRRDQEKLRGDVKRVGQNLQQAAKRHGKVTEG
ncbi:hypothetical protein [Malikia sp.]|uniref:hypothetical protein n=1 Tax=Malikia sp. TaxID=2070706 RepID=UPI002616A05E|nr:hypothetical protein [Malikia sp.]MDD2728194.1 hypothetical protein [Malikia sp.]